MFRTVLWPTILGLVCLLASASGCAKGALWRLGYLSPQARQQWAEEEKLAKTWPTMRDEMSGWVAQANAGSSADQQRVAKRLGELIETDRRMLVRLHATSLLGKLPSAAAWSSVAIAARDSDADIRVAACRVYGAMDTEDAIIPLGQLLGQDSSPDVQIAAARALGEFKSDRSARALGSAIESDQPALQLAAADSLEKVTGQKWGRDIPKWQDYLASLGTDPTDRANTEQKSIQTVTHTQPEEVRSFLDSLRR